MKIINRSRIQFVSIVLGLIVFILSFNNCSGSGGGGSSGGEKLQSGVSIALDFTRIDSAGFDPFDVTVHLEKEGTPLQGQTLTLNIPKGSHGAVTDNGDGTYKFRVTPTSSGIYPVEVSFEGTTVRRDAIVANSFAAGVGQPMLVPGMVNTDGYEDGVTITPDGQYLFVQYGPLYFSGLFLLSSICSSPNYSAYDILNCSSNTDANWVFNTIGPTASPLRPDFPTGGISNGKFLHSHISVPGVVNGVAVFPRVFYGFYKQEVGTFGEAFNVGLTVS